MFASLAVHLWLGFVLWQRGDLHAAQQSMLTGTEQNFAWGLRGIGQMYVQPFSVHILLDRGRVEQARQVLEESRSTLRIGDSVRLFLEAEARVLLEEGRPAQALAVLDEAEQQMQVVRNPVWRSWRTQRADVLHALGRTADGLALIDEEQRLAEEWGTPGPQGRTWLVRGRLEGSEGAASLRTAVDLLARSRTGSTWRGRRAALGALRRRPGRGAQPAGSRPRGGRGLRRGGPVAADRGPAAAAGGRGAGGAAALVPAEPHRAAARLDGGARDARPRDRAGAVPVRGEPSTRSSAP